MEHAVSLQSSSEPRLVSGLRRHARLSLVLIGFFGWVTALPLYGSVGTALAAAQGVTYPSLPLWFLGANVLSSILWGIAWDRWPGRAVAGARVGAVIAAMLTILLLAVPPALWPLLFALMGLNMGCVVAWGRWYATTVDAGWLGRVFGLTAAGVGLVRWLFDIAARVMAPGPALTLLTLLPLALVLLALWHFDYTIDPSREQPPAAMIDFRVKARTLYRHGLFIILFSLVAGLAYRFQVVTPVSPFVNDSLRRLPYILALMVAGILADRRHLQALMVTGAALLALSCLTLGWAGLPGPAYAGIALQGAAFGLLEAAPWLLLAGLATPATAGRWFGWGLNMNVVPIFLGGLVAIPFASLTPEHFGLIATGAVVLAVLSLQGTSDPLVLLHRWLPTARGAEPTSPGAAAPSLPVPERLRVRFGERLTERELEVGARAVLGVATKDIAGQLYLSENTVKTHLRNLFRKTGAANRNDLYRVLAEGG